MAIKKDKKAGKSPYKHTNAHHLRARLRRIAFESGAGNKFPSVSQLQERLGLSTATLWRACKDLEAEGILEAKHGVGIFVSPNLRRHVCCVCDPAFFLGPGVSPFWSMMLQNINEGLVARGDSFSIHFATSFNDIEQPLHQGFMEEVMAGRVQGVLAVGLNSAAIEWIEKQNVPLVSYAAKSTYMVISESASVIEKGLENLLERGCRRIGLWVPIAPSRHGDAEGLPKPVADFIRESKRLKVPYIPELVFVGTELWDGRVEFKLTHQQQGQYAAQKFFASSEIAPPDGIIIVDDTMAQGAFVVLSRLGVRLERDVKVVTQANRGSTTLLGYEDCLAYVENDPAAMTRVMIELLDSLMKNQIPPSKVVFLHPEFKIGENVAMPGAPVSKAKREQSAPKARANSARARK